MTARPTLDAESFQELLASAFVVQQRLMDVQFPCAIPTLRTLVATGNIDVNAAMQVIAGRARNLANANGAAIGLLKGDELVYLAGSGSAVTYVGRHMTATLSVSAKSELKGEILRVEDAETDELLEMDSGRAWTREKYERINAERLAEMDRAFRRAGVDTLRFSTAESFAHTLQQFFEKRRARRRG